MDITFKNGILPRGAVALPPSKSEAIRAALLLALSGDDPCRAVSGFPPPYCGDVRNALVACSALKDGGEMFAGDSASLLRMLLPVLLVTRGEAEVGLTQRLAARGAAELEECLGIKADLADGAIRMRGVLNRSKYHIDCSRSSQFLSGLMIALPLLGRECEIIVENGLVSKPYAEMTLAFVRRFGGDISETETGFVTRPSVYRAPASLGVTGDRSYAAVFEAMNFLGGRVRIDGQDEDTLQPDKLFSRLVGLPECDITHCPDLFPLLAACACGRTGDTVIRGTKRLRSKESDREAGTVGLIRALGGSAEVGDGCVAVHGTGRLRGGVCDTLSDHRLVFAAAVTALISESPVTAKGAECVSKSAPGFFGDVSRLFSE